MNFIYLLADIVLLMLALFLLFNKTMPRPGIWAAVIPAALVPALIFLGTSYLLCKEGILIFDERYIYGFRILGLPLEEILFCMIMPVTGLGIYIFLNQKFPVNTLQKYSLTVSNLLLGICIAMLFFAYQSGSVYSIIFDVTLVLLLIYIEYISKLRFMYRFYRASILGMLLLYPIYFIMTGLSQIPFYFMTLLLAGTYLFELFKNKAALREGAAI